MQPPQTTDAPAAPGLDDGSPTTVMAPVPGPPASELAQGASAAPGPEQPSLPAGVEPTPEGSLGFAERARARRRLRFLRRARELGYRDLGGLVFDLHRFGRERDDLIAAKVHTLAVMDQELRGLEALLGERQPVTVLHEPGIVACPRCAAIHGTETNYCPNCGLPTGGRADMPMAVPGTGAGTVTEPVAGGAPPAAMSAPQPLPGVATPPAREPAISPEAAAEPVAAREPVAAAEPVAAREPVAAPEPAEAAGPAAAPRPAAAPEPASAEAVEPPTESFSTTPAHPVPGAAPRDDAAAPVGPADDEFAAGEIAADAPGRSVWRAPSPVPDSGAGPRPVRGASSDDRPLQR